MQLVVLGGEAGRVVVAHLHSFLLISIIFYLTEDANINSMRFSIHRINPAFNFTPPPPSRPNPPPPHSPPPARPPPPCNIHHPHLITCSRLPQAPPLSRSARTPTQQRGAIVGNRGAKWKGGRINGCNSIIGEQISVNINTVVCYWGCRSRIAPSATRSQWSPST